jgi:nucleotide-binding universal stress UspA family protein
VGRLIPPLTKWVGETNAQEVSWIEKAVEMAAEELRAAGINALPLMREGEPKRVLVEAAQERGADSIFVGATRYDSRARMFLRGSVSAAVAARAHCSVEVVRFQFPQPEGV